MIKVSIIVPVYNTGKYIKKCLESLINQTLKEIEIIIINDGSTDNSDKVIKQYHDPRIKYYKRSNHGIGATRNFGINHANGEYIGFVDSDDYIETEMFEKLYQNAINQKLDIIICDHYKDNKIIKFIDFKPCSLNDNPNLLIDINLAPWNKIYKKNLFGPDTYFPINVKYEDTPFVAYMFQKAKKIGKLNEPLYHYIVHEKSETTTIDEHIFDIFKITDLLIDKMGNNEHIKSSLEDLIVYLITKYTISQRYIKNRKDRKKFINQAFKYLNQNIPQFRKVTYFKNRNIIKKIIETNKILTIIYCDIYSILKK